MIFFIRYFVRMQYRGTLSDNSKVAVGVLLFAANVIILMGPFLIICLVAFRALPKSIVQRFLGDDAPQLATAADPTGTVGEVIMFSSVLCCPATN